MDILAQDIFTDRTPSPIPYSTAAIMVISRLTGKAASPQLAAWLRITVGYVRDVLGADDIVMPQPEPLDVRPPPKPKHATPSIEPTHVTPSIEPKHGMPPKILMPPPRKHVAPLIEPKHVMPKIVMPKIVMPPPKPKHVTPPQPKHAMPMIVLPPPKPGKRPPMFRGWIQPVRKSYAKKAMPQSRAWQF